MPLPIENDGPKLTEEGFRQLTRAEIAYYVKEEYEGRSEMLTKHLWEQCVTPDDIDTVRGELVRIHAQLLKKG